MKFYLLSYQSHKIGVYMVMFTINPITHLYVTNQKSIGTRALKRRLVREGIKQEVCENPSCGIRDWLDKAITMELHHVDGDNTNNRLENLSILCPNCHSQCEIHGQSRKNRKHYLFTDEDILKHAPEHETIAQLLNKLGCRSRNPVYYNRVYEVLSRHNITLKKKSVKEKKPIRIVNKVAWPKDNVLSEMLWANPVEKVAQEIGCTTSGLQKYYTKWKISRPPMGYWLRRKNGDSHEEALIPYSHRPKRSKHKLTNDQSKWCIIQYESGRSLRSIGKELNVWHNTVSLNMEHIGYVFPKSTRHRELG